ncbi:MAG: aminotransferase class V-fold PLP-dependent enzyme [Pirellulales bacterium]|nr:aminotransferase class V-fold PLP-dependent enzyme [Pirellulales bacterium]
MTLVAAGEQVILGTAGRWGERWRGILRAYGAEVVAVEAAPGDVVTPERLAEALQQHSDAVAVFTTLCETSTGVGHDIAAFGQLVRHSRAVLVVDGISGIGAMECRMDAWGIDVLVTIGPMSQWTAEAAQAAGCPRVHPFADRDSAIARLQELLPAGCTVLVKASRGMQLEQVVQVLVSE